MRVIRGNGLPMRLTGMVIAVLSVLGSLIAVGAVAPVPARAAGATVSVSVQGGTLHTDAATTVNLSGSGFQSVQGGFGGIYVLFGWVSDPNGDSWKPSKGGMTGETYRYVPDDENNPTGYDVFVAFPGDPTASAANGGQLASDGTWHAAITVPGAKFTSVDRSNNPVNVDCTTVQCGIITIGAHGVANATNETFTPMSFDTSSSARQSNDGQTNTGVVATDSTANQSDQQSADDAAEQTADANTQNTNDNTDTENGTENAAKTTRAAASTADSTTTSKGNDDMIMTIPTWGVAGWLIVAAAIILGLSIIVLAAGVGGYLAVKALLLGISPAALDREVARRERRAAAVRAREEIRTERHRRKLHERLIKERERADKAQAMAESTSASAGSAAESERHDADSRPSVFVPGGGLRAPRADSAPAANGMVAANGTVATGDAVTLAGKES
ncbi:CDF family cation diffusion facilitator [Bifidobacterium callimiconis]|uniref:CDF family cation diffusion facilitator n=2 Tax=Bifidobacterium callimiconis TaxID=2306973 RepID=A0A430FE60_9BIFI|nr:CDF family cation diffusion facilitator [Bifidobacterium callimiconis]